MIDILSRYFRPLAPDAELSETDEGVVGGLACLAVCVDGSELHAG